MMIKASSIPFDRVALLLVTILCVALSFFTSPLRSNWLGVPPAPDKAAALSYGFGDTELSYRRIGFMLQNAGDEGGRTTNLKNYNYEILRGWFWLSFALDPKANYIPSLAAFYFGSVDEKKDVQYLVDYLARVGEENEAQNWRWLTQAIYIARFQLKDQDLALKLAYRLAALQQPDMPIWTKQMPAYVMTNNVSQKKAARDLMLTVVATDKKVNQADINQTCWYIDHKLREPGDKLESDELYRMICSVKR